MKLRDVNLPKLESLDIDSPRYSRRDTRAGIVHLGVGAFHRAHQAWYTEAVLNRFGGDWRIIGVSLRRPDMRDKLQPQDGLYSLVTRHGDAAHCQVIGAFSDLLVAPEAPEAVIAALAAAATHVVTLTITEKGYGLAAASGRLDLAHPDIAHDLTGGAAPRSAIGFLSAALARRRQQGLTGLTLLSCDNLSDNGHKLKAALLQFSAKQDADLAAWIEQHCRFPNTMVDRIVPAVTAEQIAQFRSDFGVDDSAPVFSETFSQWVIERNFAGPVPPWDKVGAEFVDDVAPFEALKLRTLNASHSLIAYLGCVTGRETVAEALCHPDIRRAVEGLMRDEAQPSLNLPGDFSIEDYQQALLTRFENTALNHRCAQIAMDGSQKIPQRLVPIIEWQLSHNASIHYASLAIAAWLLFLRGESIDTLQDPLKEQLTQLWQGSAEQAVEALLAMQSIFPDSIGGNAQLKTEVLAWLEKLDRGQLDLGT